MAEFSPARLAIYDALRQREFRYVAEAGGRLLFEGHLDRDRKRIPVSFEVRDVDFVRMPVVRLGPEYPVTGRVLPHVLGIGRSICYYEAGSVILDMYDPGGTVLQCLDRAERVLLDAMSGSIDNDFADEFGAYWGDTFVYVDLPGDHLGDARIREIQVGRRIAPVLAVTRGQSWLEVADKGSMRYVDRGEPAFVAASTAPLTLDPNGSWPPDTLSDLNAWLEWSAPELVGRVERCLQDADGLTASVIIRAPNGLFCYRITVPPALRRPEFLKARRSRLTSTLQRWRATVPVERFVGVRADVAHFSGRNLGNTRGLGARRILVVGCGTIGSFLAHQLVLCGAGTEGGVLTLVDHDVLGTGNLGRHLLGVSFLGRNKAEGCAEHLREQLPCSDVRAIARDVLSDPVALGGQDLVIDATGEEALSIALNHRAVGGRPASPPHLFAWLLGNGAAAQCILTGEPDHACLKCLKPNLAGPSRVDPLRPGVEIERISTFACGDSTFVPFPASRAAAAAAMTCDLVLDWANGAPRERFRSLTLDASQASQTPSGSPSPLPSCPACGGAR